MILILSLVVRLWSPIVATKRPVLGLNSAAETSYPLIGELPTLTVITPDCLLKPLAVAETNVCVDVSV